MVLSYVNVWADFGNVKSFDRNFLSLILLKDPQNTYIRANERRFHEQTMKEPLTEQWLHLAGR